MKKAVIIDIISRSKKVYKDIDKAAKEHDLSNNYAFKYGYLQSVYDNLIRKLEQELGQEVKA